MRAPVSIRRTRNSTPRQIASAVWKSGWCSTRRIAADSASSTRATNASCGASRRRWQRRLAAPGQHFLGGAVETGAVAEIAAQTAQLLEQLQVLGELIG